jgi:multidrug efflux pump
MSLSRPFILRPVATSLFMLAILFCGLLTYRLLPVAALPQVDYPIIQVFTFNPGAHPEVMARNVTAPLERNLGQIPGLKQLSSTSATGASIITLQFALEIDLGVAEQEVQSALNNARSLLPNDLPAPPLYRKVNPADSPIITLAVTSDGLSLPEVYDLVNNRMAQKLAQLPGVGMVTLAGGQKPAIRIKVNPNALASAGLSMEQVRSTVVAANTNQPKGSFDGPLRSTMLNANDQIREPSEYANLILQWRDDAPLRLGDVATIENGAEDRFLAAWANEQPAVLINIQRQPGANVIDVANRIEQLLPRLRDTMPKSVDIAVLADRTQSIRASIRDVQKELIFAIGLVVAVTFVFLRSLPATIIPSLAVPLSIIGTFVAMYFLGFSINNLTLMALTIATGFVVDDAIVMLENISRHREKGETALNAALKGAGEIGFTLVSLTVSLIAVLIPLLFMGDLVGRLFQEFAITLAIAIAISLVVSLTLTPMLCARMLKDDAVPAHDAKDFMTSTIDAYGRGLTWVLNHRRLTMTVMVGTIIFTAGLYVVVPKGFFPVQDSGVIQVVTEAPQTISFSAMSEKQTTLASAILKDDAVESLSSFIGVDGNNASLNTGRIQVNLKSHADRDIHAVDVIARLKAATDQISGITAWYQPIQELSIEDRVSRTQYQFTLTAPDVEVLDAHLSDVLARVGESANIQDVTADLQNRGLQAYIDIDRDAAMRLGVRMVDISNALQSAYGQRQIATLFTQANQYRVVIEADPELSQGLDALANAYVTSTTGNAVPLSALATITQRPTPLMVTRQGQFPTITLSFNLTPGASLGAALSDVNNAIEELALPPAIEMRWQGAAAAFAASLSNTLWLMLAAVITMYIVLGILYESFIHPVTILSTLPSAAVGAFLALLLVGRPLDMIAIIGVILLIGLVKKNGIMMVDFALAAQREQGLSPRDAIYQAALMRFRPILMTTLAALFGAIPLMLANGSGAELRQPLGIVMVGGLLVSQVLTLFTTPVVYLFFDRWVNKPQTSADVESRA